MCSHVCEGGKKYPAFIPRLLRSPRLKFTFRRASELAKAAETFLSSRLACSPLKTFDMAPKTPKGAKRTEKEPIEKDAAPKAGEKRQKLGQKRIASYSMVDTTERRPLGATVGEFGLRIMKITPASRKRNAVKVLESVSMHKKHDIGEEKRICCVCCGRSILHLSQNLLEIPQKWRRKYFVNFVDSYCLKIRPMTKDVPVQQRRTSIRHLLQLQRQHQRSPRSLRAWTRLSQHHQHL